MKIDRNQWEHISWQGANQYGWLFIGRCEYERDMFEENLVVIKDNGKIEVCDICQKRGICSLYLDNGYLSGNISDYLSVPKEEQVDKILDVTFYDYQGNEIETYELAKQIILMQGYSLRKYVYQNGSIMAFYVQEGEKELYISKVTIDIGKSSFQV